MRLPTVSLMVTLTRLLISQAVTQRLRLWATIAGFDTPDQYQYYCMHGGGKEMLQKIYDGPMPEKLRSWVVVLR